MRIATTPSTSASHGAATIRVAMDLSNARWLVAVHTPLDDKDSRNGLTGADSRARLEHTADLVAEELTRLRTQSQAAE